MNCKMCNSDKNVDADSFYKSNLTKIMKEKGICFNCAFWEEHARNFEAGKDKGKVFIVKGNRYHDGGKVDKKTTRGFMGFGGADWRIRILATGEIKETNNLWHQGEIPEYFRERLPDNAEFLK